MAWAENIQELCRSVNCGQPGTMETRWGWLCNDHLEAFNGPTDDRGRGQVEPCDANGCKEMSQCRWNDSLNFCPAHMRERLPMLNSITAKRKESDVATFEPTNPDRPNPKEPLDKSVLVPLSQLEVGIIAAALCAANMGEKGEEITERYFQAYTKRCAEMA